MKELNEKEEMDIEGGVTKQSLPVVRRTVTTSDTSYYYRTKNGNFGGRPTVTMKDPNNIVYSLPTYINGFRAKRRQGKLGTVTITAKNKCEKLILTLKFI